MVSAIGSEKKQKMSANAERENPAIDQTVLSKIPGIHPEHDVPAAHSEAVSFRALVIFT